MSRLETIKGIGPKVKEKLSRSGIHDCFDLIRYYPRRYEVFELVTLTDAPDGVKVTIEGVVSSAPVVSYIRRNLNRLTFQVTIEGRNFQVVVFNRDYLKNLLAVGEEIVLTGTLDRTKRTFTASTLRQKKNFTSEIEPIYNVEGISDKQLGKWIQAALDEYGSFLVDDLPDSLKEKYHLLDYHRFLRIIHAPTSTEDLRQADRRIKYEELFKFQLKMQYLRLKHRSKTHRTKHYDIQRIRSFIDRLPYELTHDQKQATNEIMKDIKSPYVMNRLLQGDVGSGKTIVAAITILAVLDAGRQVALMAPTELLAQQHHRTFTRLFQDEDVDVVLLTGKLGSSERQSVLDRLADERPVLVIGTHALFSDDVFYADLGYVITDEQHRFGVEQRRRLRKKGIQPDVLYLSATPIPRTLAISLFGDMDLSTIRQKPASRKPIETKLFANREIDLVYLLLDEQLRLGRQAYVVTPLILEGETSDLHTAQQVYRDLSQRFSDYNVGLMHSKIKQDDKERVMLAFEQGEIHILVSTTVIEVGVDVANATMMVVFDSDRFGLSQLHQLRGRIGRGEHKSHCLLLYGGDQDVQERLSILERTDDGFRLSEEDLRLRGPGEFFGYRQSGDLKFLRADIVADQKILELARQDALDLLTDAKNYTDPTYEPLFQYLKQVLKRANLD
jgi:ATP-dependent DNA helicase RecG